LRTTALIRIVRISTALGLLLAAALLAACSASPGAEGASSEPAGSSSAPVKPPTLVSVTPASGAAVPAGTLDVTVETTDLKFTMASNTNVAGEGHVHFTLDDRPFEMSIEPTFQFEDVDPGKHTLEAELVQNNTESFDPPVKQVIEFTAQ